MDSGAAVLVGGCVAELGPPTSRSTAPSTRCCARPGSTRASTTCSPWWRGTRRPRVRSPEAGSTGRVCTARWSTDRGRDGVRSPCPGARGSALGGAGRPAAVDLRGRAHRGSPDAGARHPPHLCARPLAGPPACPHRSGPPARCPAVGAASPGGGGRRRPPRRRDRETPRLAARGGAGAAPAHRRKSVLPAGGLARSGRPRRPGGAANRAIRAPDSVRDTFQVRLDALAAPSRQLLERAAVLGDESGWTSCWRWTPRLPPPRAPRRC